MTTTPVAPPRRAWVEQIMGMPISVHVRGPEVDAGPVAHRVAAVFAELRHLDRVFSPYRDDSDLSRWERGELQPGAADPTLPEVFALCDEARERTEGWFDPRGLPDPRGGAPRYDPCGLVKGWAVRRVSRHLADLDGYGWCLNAGGDAMVASPARQPAAQPAAPPAGQPAGQLAWRVGIEDPSDPARVLRVVTVGTGAVATSGSAHRGAHIIDPYTRRPADAVRAVTVVGPDLLWADVYATAAVARGVDALTWLATIDGYQGLLVDAWGAVGTTAGWPAA